MRRPKYPIPEPEKKTLENNFTYHPPRDDQQERYVLLRDQFRQAAKLVLEMCPPSRERALALTSIETACMWANASIARNEK